MPPIHLVLWGDPGVEVPEDQEVFLAWELELKDYDCAVTKVSNPDPEAIRQALKTAIEDEEAQIVYFSCHGCEDGFSFSRRDHPNIPFNTLSAWLHAITPKIAENDVGYDDRTLVFGFCESMHPGTRIETLMPKWVMRVVGFVGSPQAPEVAQLVAGEVLNLEEWVSETFAGTGRLLDEMPVIPGESEWERTRRAFEAAADNAPDEPARNVHKSLRASVVIAKRNHDTLQWSREYGAKTS